MTKRRLDIELSARGLVSSRSQAESWIKLGRVMVDGQVIDKAGYFVAGNARITLDAQEQYVSRAGLKLASVAGHLGLDFADKIVLDIGSSTGGFTDYALQHGARRVYAVDVGTDQLHPSLRGDPRIELHERTDIRDFIMPESPDIVVIDVSFISLRDILAWVASAAGTSTHIVAMLKPQFEAGRGQLGSSGVVKNDRVRRDIMREFEVWAKSFFVVIDKSDSAVAGARGNVERFYLLQKSSR